MRKPLQAHAKVYAGILAQLYTRQGIGGKLESAARGARCLTLATRLNDPYRGKAAIELAEPLALATKTRAVIATRQEGQIIYQFELQAGFWESYTRAELPTAAAVGLAESHRPVVYTFEDAPHSLFAGATGSGKTRAIESALLAVMAQNTPAETGLLIADSNTELTDFQNAAHLAAPIATEPAAIDALIAFAHRELVTRRAAGNKGGKRLLLVIDEVSDVLTPGNLAMLKDIAKQGRKYQINLMVGTQRTGQKQLPEILDNLLNRFIGQVDNAQTSVLLTGQAGLQAHKLTGKGDFLHLNGGQVERCQIALATQADFAAIERQPAPVLPEPEPAAIADLPDDDTEPEPAGGRPALQVTPAGLALYVHNRALTIGQAQQAGISRRAHYLHKTFAGEFIAELKRLRGQNG